MDSLRYWVTEMHVDGFRFDLASTLARAAARGRPALELLHHHPSGSRSLSQREAHRRAVGRRRGRLPGRQLPGALGGVERHATATRCARFWRGDGGNGRRARLPAHRQQRSLRRATAARPSASINFVTAHDGFTLRDLVTLQRQAQRGQRRGQPRRHRRQALLELRRRGADRRPGRQRAPRAPAAQPAGDAAALAGHADDRAAATSSGAPSAATTTPTARTTSSSWLDWVRSDPHERADAALLFEFTKRLIAHRGARTRRCTARSSSRAGASAAPTCTTSCGSATTAR